MKKILHYLPLLFFTLFITTVPGAAEKQVRGDTGGLEIVFDFESGDLQGWRIVEGRLGEPVSDRKFFFNRPQDLYNKQGRYFLTTLIRSGDDRSDKMTGTLESPVFELQSEQMTFLIGGGSHQNQTYVALCTIDGTEVLKAYGKNAEEMRRVTWNTQSLIREKVYLKVVDAHDGGWGHITCDDFRTLGTIDDAATRRHLEQREQAIREKALSSFRIGSAKDVTNLRAAIRDLSGTFEDEYPKAEEFLSHLEQIEGRIKVCTTEEIESLQTQLAGLRYEALKANPLLNRNPILYVARNQYLPDHHNTATLFQNGEINTGSFRGGSALRVIDYKAGGTVTTLLDVPEGVVRDPEVHFDGKRIVVSIRWEASDDTHIYEINRDGSGLYQLTFGKELSDFDPIYAPGGEIVFVSTREPKLCQCNRHIMGNLFAINPDGSNLHQLGRNTLFEGHPSMMPDGRILYDRWEYVDKHFGPAMGLWTVNPDGTNHAIYYGNNAWAPGAILDARIVPGTECFVATFGSCHDRPWGAIAVVDRRKGLDGIEPVVKSWPENIAPYITNHHDYGKGMQRGHPAGGQIDNFTRLQVKYEDPYPLSEKYFLCSRMVEGERMGIFLLDVFGNEILLHEEEALGCFDPMPIASRATPPPIPPRMNFSLDHGLVYVMDVYQGEGMENVERGSVRWLRIVEAPPKLYWTQTNWNLDATQAPAMNWNCTNNKRILGKVPVEPDGSAYFKMPADRFVFFQLLDENDMMVQSMRSGTMVQAGEVAGCIGCHENRLTTAPNQGVPKAMQRPANDLIPWYGEPRDFNYLTEVQPVFDRHCVQCHDYGKPAGEKLNLSGDLGLVFNTSYQELRSKSAYRWFLDSASAPKLLVKAVDDGPAEILPAYAWGSHRSRLVDVIRSGHKGTQLDKESMDRIITWIDMNAPYYGSYASVYPDNVFGRSPLNDEELKRLREITGVAVGEMDTEMRGSQVNFTRPEMSPCLQELQEKNETLYQEALGIIQIGQLRLAETPRMDMPGARLNPVDLKKLKKYESYVSPAAQIKNERIQKH